MYYIANGRLPQLPRAAVNTDKPSPSARSEAQTWQSSNQVDVCPDSASKQGLDHTSFMNSVIDLSVLANDIATTTRTPRTNLIDQSLFKFFEAFRDWHRSLPQHLQLGQSPLPHVFFLHMYYHSCVLQYVSLKDVNKVP
jgi:hypothetical protein